MLKRAMDVAIALPLLIVMSLPMLVVAALIAWCLLRVRGSISLVFAAGAIALYAASTAAIWAGSS